MPLTSDARAGGGHAAPSPSPTSLAVGVAAAAAAAAAAVLVAAALVGAAASTPSASPASSAPPAASTSPAAAKTAPRASREGGDARGRDAERSPQRGQHARHNADNADNAADAADAADAVTPTPDATGDDANTEAKASEEAEADAEAAPASPSPAGDTSVNLYKTKAAVAKEALRSGLDLDVDAVARELGLLRDWPSDFDAPPRRDVHASIPNAFVVDGLLSEAECALLVERTETCGGYSFWTQDEKQRSFRACDTIEVEHEQLAAMLWRRLERVMRAEPDLTAVTIESQEQDPMRYARDLVGTWVAYNTNPCVLFSRYGEGGHFAAHTDGFNVRGFDDRSMFSIVLYLNTVPPGCGGETTFYADEARQSIAKDAQGRLVADEALAICSVSPVAGRVLVFFHNVMHQSQPVAAGSGARKYIIRSDVMYQRSPPLLTEARDLEAYDEIRRADQVAETDPDEAARIYRRAYKKSWKLGKIYGM